MLSCLEFVTSQFLPEAANLLYRTVFSLTLTINIINLATAPVAIEQSAMSIIKFLHYVIKFWPYRLQSGQKYKGLIT